eukprot:TCALIF_12147-PA protein Name:"Similar to GPATCH11 G patch domain-containing protein 11 (Bos taurus)" AED:0.17 eAED:0.20 QI:82/0/0/1/1/0.75/4/0/275
MSEAFLSQCVQKDIRPGLKRTLPKQREHELAKQRSEGEQRRQAAKWDKRQRMNLESEKREEGLQKSLDTSNKGFAMLAKMGYKSGQSLGKSNSGRVEPIGIQIKIDRGGLGREAVLQEIALQKTTMMRARMARKARATSTQSIQEYRAHMSRQRKLQMVEVDLRKSQKSCFQLDSAKEIRDPAESWFWPPKVQDAPPIDPDSASNEPSAALINEEDEKDDDNDDICELEVDEQLEILTNYLRMQYFYCLWCGTTFTDEPDIVTNCPGRTRQDHDD